MSRICTLPAMLRQHVVQKLHANSFNRNLCNSSRLLTKSLTLNRQSEFQHRETYQNASLFDPRKFYSPPMHTQNAWRRYSTQNKPPANFSNRPASSGNDDDDHLHEDEELDFIEETDEELGEYTDHDDDGGELDEEYLLNLEGKKNSVPSTNTVPDYFPKVPMIATPFPVFPKFMKVFEVTDPNLIKLLEWVRLNMLRSGFMFKTVAGTLVLFVLSNCFLEIERATTVCGCFCAENNRYLKSCIRSEGFERVPSDWYICENH